MKVDFSLFSSVIYQPRDPYKNRPLPHLIGSKEWHEQWHVGLLLSDADDNSDSENVDAMSESSSESSSSDVPAGSLSESGSPVKILPPKKSTGNDEDAHFELIGWK